LKLFAPAAVLPIADDGIDGGPEMLKSNLINLLGIVAALAVSSLLLGWTAAESPVGTQPANVIAAEAALAAPIVIKSYPSDTFIIEALPAK
jgi:hypothetical protein